MILSVFVSYVLGTLGVSAYRFASSGAQEKLWTFVALAVGAAIFCAAALSVLRKPWELERFTRRFSTLLVCLYLGLTLSAFAQRAAGSGPMSNPTWRTVIAAISFQGIAIFFIWRFLREHHTSWADAFGFQRGWKMSVLYGVLLAVSFLPFGWLLQTGSVSLLEKVNFHSEVQPAVQALKNTVAWFDRAAIALAALVLAPVAEEMLFRGIFYPAIKQAGFPKLAWWGTALLFAAVHAHLATLAPLFLFALLLTWIYEQTDNLLAPIAAHAMFNALNFGVYYLTEGRFS